MALIKIIMKRTEVQTKLNLRWEDYRLPQQVLLIFQLANKQWGMNTGSGTQIKNFPINFGTIFTAVSNGINQWHTGQCEASNTQIKTYCYHSDSPNNTEGGPVKWIAIGSE
jgi:hypothetical protein